MNTHFQKKYIQLNTGTIPALVILAVEAEKFCGRWMVNLPNPSLLLLAGAVRTGKTHVAEKIFRFCHGTAFQAFEKGHWGRRAIPSAQMVRWPEVVGELTEKNRSSLDDCFRSDLLVLDDVGADNDPWKIGGDALCQILSRREDKFTVITTNIRPLNWDETFDNRVCDRFLRNSKVVDLFDVKPYRA